MRLLEVFILQVFMLKVLVDASLPGLGMVTRYKAISRAGFFGSGSGLRLTKISGLRRAFFLGAQKYN